MISLPFWFLLFSDCFSYWSRSFLFSQFFRSFNLIFSRFYCHFSFISFSYWSRSLFFIFFIFFVYFCVVYFCLLCFICHLTVILSLWCLFLFIFCLFLCCLFLFIVFYLSSNSYFIIMKLIQILYIFVVEDERLWTWRKLVFSKTKLRIDEY